MMNTKTRFSMMGALLVVMAVCATGFALAGQQATVSEGNTTPMTEWTAVASSGPVESKANAWSATWRKVSRGDRLQPQTHLRTGRRGRVTLAWSSSVILVDPQSELVLPSGQADVATNRIRQTSGTALYQIAPRIESTTETSFEVDTPYLVAGVKGTIFSVSVDEGVSSVAVREGRVEVRSRGSNEVRDLFAGDMAVVDHQRGELDVVRMGQESDRLTGLELAHARRARNDVRRLERRMEKERDKLEDDDLDADDDGLERGRKKGQEGQDPDREDEDEERARNKHEDKNEVEEEENQDTGGTTGTNGSTPR